MQFGAGMPIACASHALLCMQLIILVYYRHGVLLISVLCFMLLFHCEFASLMCCSSCSHVRELRPVPGSLPVINVHAGGEVSPATMFEMEQMHTFEWSIDRHSKVLEQAKSSRMLSAVVELLGGRVAGGNSTTIFVGHDIDINGLGILLNVGWHAPPFADK